jgi:Winged helix-turn helix
MRLPAGADFICRKRFPQSLPGRGDTGDGRARTLDPARMQAPRLVGDLELGRLGWSVQRPSGQARERDERAIRTWKAKRSALKKSLRDKAE